jgi:glycosyltransferase involved in cell wall biosynthesis
MKSTPLCSIVIPAFNAEAYISEAIQSVLAQSFSNWELIVIDDGSRDGTVQIIRKFKDQRIRLVRQENAGAGAARNRGIEESCGSIICFLDADDRLCPDALKRLLVALKGTPHACLAYGEPILMDASGRVFGKEKGSVLARRPSGWVLGYILERNFILTPSGVAVRADYLTKVGDFRTDLPPSEDWELWCRLATVGEFIRLGGEPVVEYRIRPDSVARTLGATVTARFRAVNAVFSNPVIKGFFDERELVRLRRKREAQIYGLSGVECLRTHNWSEARKYLFESLRRDCMRPIRLLRLGVSLLRWMPPGVERWLM